MIASVAAFLEGMAAVMEIIRQRRDAGSVSDLIQMREALKSLHFSERTIDRLRDRSSPDYGYVAITQRDTANNVVTALQTLATFGGDSRSSILIGRLIGELTDEKLAIRQDIAASLHGKQLDDLVKRIHDLNNLLEMVDNELGGAIL